MGNPVQRHRNVTFWPAETRFPGFFPLVRGWGIALGIEPSTQNGSDEKALSDSRGRPRLGPPDSCDTALL